MSLKIVDYRHMRPLHGQISLVLALRRVEPTKVMVYSIIDITVTVDILWIEVSIIDLPGVSICGCWHAFRWCLNRARRLIEDHLRCKVDLRKGSLYSITWGPTWIHVLKVLLLLLLNLVL